MTWYEKLDKAIEVYLPDLPLERDVPMSRYTSFRIGGPAVGLSEKPGTACDPYGPCAGVRRKALCNGQWNESSGVG